MPTTTLEVTLPKPPPQWIDHAKRIVTVSGSLNDGGYDVAIDSTAPISLKADLHAKIHVEVIEVLANGRRSPPCVLDFIPHEHVPAAPADPSGFAVKVTGVDADTTPSAPVATTVATDPGPASAPEVKA